MKATLDSGKCNFEIGITDPRCPDVKVVNTGTILFTVMISTKQVDSFVEWEMAGTRQVGIFFAKDRAEKFFDYLVNHPWLLKKYHHKHI